MCRPKILTQYNKSLGRQACAREARQAYTREARHRRVRVSLVRRVHVRLVSRVHVRFVRCVHVWFVRHVHVLMSIVAVLQLVWPSKFALLRKSKRLTENATGLGGCLCMLCHNVCECGTVGHDASENMGVGVAVNAGFVDGVVDSLTLSCQRSVMLATKLAEVYTVRTWVVRVLSDVFREGGVPNIVLGPSFCMSMFVKCVWMCALEC